MLPGQSLDQIRVLEGIEQAHDDGAGLQRPHLLGVGAPDLEQDVCTLERGVNARGDLGARGGIVRISDCGAQARASFDDHGEA